MDVVIQSSFYGAVLLFIFGLKGMGHPKTARAGIVWAGVGMLVATLATFFLLDILTAQTLEFLSITLLEPAILSSQEGWFATLEVLPIASALFTIATVFLVIIFSRSFVMRVSLSLLFPFRHAV